MFKAMGGWSAQLTDKTYQKGLGWVETTSSSYPLVCCVCPKVVVYTHIHAHTHTHQKTRVPPNSSDDFGNVDGFWDVFLASLVLRFCIYIYIHTIHDILNSCGWRTGNPARFNRWSSLTEAIFQHERIMQQLVVSCILDFPTHFCGINPISTLFVRSWCTMVEHLYHIILHFCRANSQR